jgi:hypothetical protein
MRLAEGHAMTDTSMVPRKRDGDRPARRPLVDEELADQLLGKAQAEGVELLGPDGLLSQVTKAVLERALAEEMTGHLGYDKHDLAGRGSGNSRNGATGKTVLTDIGAVDLAVPRDRAGTFEPQIVRKGQTRLDGFNERIIALYARGMTTRDIRAHLREMYGVDVSPDLISRVTGAVIDELTEWQARPLDAVYPVIFIDALMVKIRVLSLIMWLAGQEYAFSEQFQAGAAEHLAFEHFEPVDVAFDWSGAVGQGQAVADGVEVAAQVVGEGGQRRQGVVFGGGDPGAEAVAVAAGHHRGEGPDVAGEPVEVGVAAADAAQFGGVAPVEVVGVGHDPGGDLADRGWFPGRVGRVAAAVAELAQVALDCEFAAGIAQLLDLAEQLGGVAFAFVPALVQVPGVGVDQVGALFGLGDQVIDAAGGGELAHGGRVQSELAADR